MKFEDKSNPYFGGGKLSMREWVKKDVAEMEKEMQKKNWESDGVPYGLDEIKTYIITIAGGGPSMEIEIDTRKGEILGGQYNYAWWGSPESVEIDEVEAETIARYYDVYISDDSE